jgi:hypothetical protein
VPIFSNVVAAVEHDESGKVGNVVRRISELLRPHWQNTGVSAGPVWQYPVDATTIYVRRRAQRAKA